MTDLRPLQLLDNGQDEQFHSFSTTIPQSYLSWDKNGLSRHPRKHDSSDLQSKTYRVLSSDEHIASTPPHMHIFKFTPAESCMKNTAFRRIGRATFFTLLLSPLVTIAILSFLAFLSYENFNNRIWHTIMIKQWSTRVISISSLALRTIVDLQAGIATAMIASLALESGIVYLKDAAAMSTARANMAGPMAVLRLTLFRSTQGFVKEKINIAGVVLLCLTTSMMQFGSTILLSDLSLGVLPGPQIGNAVAYDFAIPSNTSDTVLPGGWYISNLNRPPDYSLQPRTTTWKRNPPAYPVFGEYVDPVSPQMGVDDTGVLLRAFLPFADAQSRENIRNYSGKAIVLDSRVSCQRPQLANLSVQIIWLATNVGAITGTFTPTIQADRLWLPTDPVPFNCSYISVINGTSICQLGRLGGDEIGNSAGGVLSEFANVTDLATLQTWAGNTPSFITWGTPMLILNSTITPKSELKIGRNILADDSTSLIEESGLWTVENGIWTDVLSHDGLVNVSVSVCYTAWDTARLDVNMYSDQNRSEPIAQWHPDTGFFTTPDVVYQLSNKQNQSAILRQIMSLQNNGSWIPKPEDAIAVNYTPFVQLFGDMSGDTRFFGQSMNGNWTTYMSPRTDYTLLSNLDEGQPDMFPDENIATLFNNIYETENSLAGAVSSLVTVLSSMAYYDQMPRFQTTTKTTQVYFLTVLCPRSHKGFWVVCTLLLVHNVIIGVIAVSFLLKSRHTLLGNYWQNVAQLHTPQTLDLILKSHTATDKEVSSLLNNRGKGNDIFKLGHEVLGFAPNID